MRFIEQTGFFADAHQRSDVVEQINEEKDEHDFDESDLPCRADVELSGGRGDVGKMIGLGLPRDQSAQRGDQRSR